MEQDESPRSGAARRVGPPERVAVLVDCDNVSPAILEGAMAIAAELGRVVVRRGYGNQGTLGNRWMDALTRLGFASCLQYQQIPGKNTADIALALDALEIVLEGRADIVCLVTSDSDFACVCRKLRERGATVCVIGVGTTPVALRNAGDAFHEWPAAGLTAGEAVSVAPKALARGLASCDQPVKSKLSKKPQRPPRFIIDAVRVLTGKSSERLVCLSALGQYLKQERPKFRAKAHGFPGLLDMVKACDMLTARKEGRRWFVGLEVTVRQQCPDAATAALRVQQPQGRVSARPGPTGGRRPTSADRLH